MATNKLPIQVTPRGHAAYAWLAKPDTKFANGGPGIYKITVLLDKESMGPGRQNFGKTEVSGREWIRDLLALATSVGASGVIGESNCPVKDGDRAGSKPEFAGKLIVAFKTAYAPVLIDSKGTPLPKSMTVFSGDLVRVSFQPKHNVSVERVKDGATGVTSSVETNFLSMFISKVMLVEKLTGTGGGAEMFGEEGDDGFVVPTDVPADDVSEFDQGGIVDADMPDF